MAGDEGRCSPHRQGQCRVETYFSAQRRTRGYQSSVLPLQSLGCYMYKVMYMYINFVRHWKLISYIEKVFADIEELGVVEFKVGMVSSYSVLLQHTYNYLAKLLQQYHNNRHGTHTLKNLTKTHTMETDHSLNSSLKKCTKFMQMYNTACPYCAKTSNLIS